MLMDKAYHDHYLRLTNGALAMQIMALNYLCLILHILDISYGHIHISYLNVLYFIYQILVGTVCHLKLFLNYVLLKISTYTIGISDIRSQADIKHYTRAMVVV